MQHQEFEAPYELRDTIKCLWYNKWDADEIKSGFEVVPDGYAEIIFHFGNGCSITTDAGLQPLPSPFMMGLLNQPVVFYAHGRLEIIGIRCFPWTVFDLLGLPPGKGGVRTFAHRIAQLQPTLNNLVDAGSVAGALAMLKQYFLNTALRFDDATTLFKAGAAMRHANGTMPVSQVAAAAHATVRTLERKFKQSSGYSVKNVSALMRFEEVRNHLWLYPDCNLASLAHQLGYADQPHLSREFKRYSGTTPAVFAKKAKSGKSAMDGDFVAFVQA